MRRMCAITMLFLVGSVFTFATSYVGLPKGTIHHAYVEYEDADSITITAGYGECNGNYFEVTQSQVYDVNYIPTGEDFIYVYVDDSASNFPTATFCDSTTEPAWSDAKLGWYNGDDRCIGVVWTSSSTSTITEFASNSKLTYITVGDNLKQVLTSGNPTDSYEFLETTAYIPINAISVRVTATNYDMDSWLLVSVRAYGVAGSKIGAYSYYAGAIAGWLELERGCSRDLEWLGWNDDDNYFTINIHGYQIER